ncbi:zinc chelation protein SecC [Neiella marina]|uniref:Zinc chelation protein SecC n=1 Tax=Neiella holothuriorum TaxID=2870530 RepID=A0ABS7ECX7_9GAMM|nr:YchJ family metal-binding protein [Neiella holothuriorum]MBW8190189.1 zinc chelation protein SecC [Neiella holothuriorum]
MKKNQCPCGSMLAAKQCCSAIHLNPKLARHPEQLMRARYSAHATGDLDFILKSWHPSTRPADADAIKTWNDSCAWLALNVAQSHKLGTKGVVEFVALYRQSGQLKQHHEVANFRFEKGRWWYLDRSD